MYTFKSILEKLESNLLSAPDAIRFALESNISFKWHPLGFIVSTLFERGNEKIRLHLWPKNISKPQEPKWLIHDHNFSFQSWVLAGEMKNVVYKSSEGYKYAIYETGYTHKSSVLQKTDELLNLEVQEEKTFTSGSQYFMDAGSFHQSYTDGNTSTATILHTKSHSSSSPRVIGTLDGEDYYEYHREVVPEDQMRVILKLFETD